MTKLKLLSLLTLILLLPSFSFAQDMCGIQNEGLKTLGNTAGTAVKLATDKKGRILNSPQSTQSPFTNLKVTTDTAETASTTTVLVATAHVAVVGDYILFTAGTAGNIGFGGFVSAIATNSITLATALPATPANGDAFTIYRSTPNTSVFAEDTAYTTGDLGVHFLGVRRDTPAAQASDNEYMSMTLNRSGAVICDLDANFQGNAAANVGTSPIRLEDAAFATGEAVMMSGTQYRSSAVQGAGTTGDISTINTDIDGRVYINPVGAAPSETFQSCGTATAVTSDVAMKAAVASNRMYVTSITCKNTSTTVGPNMDFKDGSTIIAVGAIPANSATGVLNSSFVVNFPTPLRGTVNTALNFATNAATTSVTCCAHGYISGN